MTHFTTAYHISPVNVQTNYCNNYLLILDVIQLNKIMKIYYFHTLKFCGMARVKLRCIMGCLELVSGKRPNVNRPPNHEIIFMKQNFLSNFSSDPPKTLSRASVDPFKIARKETFKNMSTFAIQIKH